jgi:hypothetical protein
VLRFDLLINVDCVNQPQALAKKRSIKHDAGLDVWVKETAPCNDDKTGRQRRKALLSRSRPKG